MFSRKSRRDRFGFGSGWSHNPKKKYKKSKKAKHSSKKRRGKKGRRSTAVLSSGRLFSGVNLKLIGTGAIALIAVKAFPAMLVDTTSPWKLYGSQAAIAIGGGYLANKFVGKGSGTIWAGVCLASVAADLLNKYVVSSLTARTPGSLSAFPFQNLSAFPFAQSENLSDMGGVGEVGATGYDIEDVYAI